MSLLFYGTGFPIRENSLSKNANDLRCYRTVSAIFSDVLSLILHPFKFQSVHVKGVGLIFSFKFSVLYITLSRR